MTTDNITTTPPATITPKKKGGKRKFGVAGVLFATLAIGFVIGKGGSGPAEAAATTTPPVPVTVTAPPVTVTAPAPAQATVTMPPPPPVTVTAEPAAPKAGTGPDDPKNNGKFLLGSQINSGTWQCSEAKKIGTGSNEMDMAYWEVTDQANGIVENGNDTIAVVGSEGYTVTLSGCATTWTKA